MTYVSQIHPMEFWVTQAVGQSQYAQEGLAGVSSTRPYLVRPICGFRPAHFPPLLSGSPTSTGDLQNILLA